MKINPEIILYDGKEALRIVAIQKHKTIAELTCLLKPNGIQLTDIFVVEKYRKNKLGSKILNRLYDYAKENKYPYIFGNFKTDLPNKDELNKFFIKNNYDVSLYKHEEFQEYIFEKEILP